MRFVILCVGTDGDVLPMMAIGSKLVELGHLVEIHSHSRYEELAIANRVFFYPLNTDNTETDDKFQLSTHYIIGRCL